MTLIYRFENEAERGPFSGGASDAYDDAQRTHNLYHSCRDMPTLYSVVEQGSPAHTHYMNNGAAGYHFGFTSKRQLKFAFPSSVGRKAMEAHGQTLKVFEVPEQDILKGASQCIFRRDRAVLVAILNIKTLKEEQS